MKLVVAIVPQERSPLVINGLLKEDFKATVVEATDGFTRQGAVALLVGVEEESAEAVKAIIEAYAQEATTFAIDVERYERL